MVRCWPTYSRRMEAGLVVMGSRQLADSLRAGSLYSPCTAAHHHKRQGCSLIVRVQVPTGGSVGGAARLCQSVAVSMSTYLVGWVHILSATPQCRGSVGRAA